MARIIVEALEGELNVLWVHKLRGPRNPEAAVGAVTVSGERMISALAERLGVSEEYLRREEAHQVAAMKTMKASYVSWLPHVSSTGRQVIVVDDGVATGFTMLVALKAVRKESPSRLVAALAVAPSPVLEDLRGIADEVVCLFETKDFTAVGQFFEDFSQVTEMEMREALKGVSG